MRIGIAGPIEVKSLCKYLPNLNDSDLQLGLGGTAVNLIILGLLEEGHQVTVFTLDTNIKKKYIIEGERLKIIFGHFRKSWKLQFFDFLRVEYLQIKNFITEEKLNLDIINAHWSYEYAIGTLLSKFTPYLITFRDDSPTILKLTRHPYRIIRLMMDFWVRYKGTSFSYNSEYLKKKINIDGVVIPNPVPEESISNLYRTFSTGKSTINIFFIANGGNYRKNPETALKAFLLLHEKFDNVYLFFVGKGFEIDKKFYNKITKRYTLRNVFFKGEIKHDLLLELLTDCDILLHTSREESFGNTLIEAMSKGIPVVGGEKSGAVPWVLDYGKAGILVEVNDEEKVCLALQSLITDKNKYEELSKNGIENVRQRFALNKVTNQYLLEYEKQIKRQLNSK